MRAAGSLRGKARSYRAMAESNSPELWDGLAKPFSSYERVTPYAKEFIERAGILPGESVLDVCCGSGTLAIPLADMGHHVVGVDFSPKMLQSVREAVESEGIDLVDLIECALEDDWDAAGVPSCDVAVCSRALLFGGVADAIRKIDSHATRRVCLTVNASDSMFTHPALERALGREPFGPPAMQRVREAVETGFELGRMVEVSYIRSEKTAVFETPEEARVHLESRIGGLRDGEREAFERYCSEHVVAHQAADGTPDGWCCDECNESAWAFIAWDKSPSG